MRSYQQLQSKRELNSRPAQVRNVRIALCQIDTTVGDIEGNRAKIMANIDRARRASAKLALFPELAVSGYPPEDLLFKAHFLDACKRSLDSIAAEVEGITVLVGFPERNGSGTFNSMAVIEERSIKDAYRKTLLPNYGVFDEKRYFQPGSQATVAKIGDELVGLTICEDIWQDGPPVEGQVKAGASIIANISASPYQQQKGNYREEIFSQRARKYGIWLTFCNAVGGQDELVFDGHSLAIAPSGEMVARGKQFQQDLLVFDSGGETSDAALSELLGPDAEVYEALKLGTHDYVEKNGFENVVIGLSGGIDSSLVAAVASDAIGAQRVKACVMPSPFTSKETRGDAHRLIENLGVTAYELDISPAMRAYDEVLDGPFKGTKPGVAEENIQARIRGNLLMALSNKFGWLLLTTGNKSEYSVGYATLYGDMAGGFAVIKDVPKTLVYRLARYRNEIAGHDLIPDSIIERAPSAELKEGQLDQDTLPVYELLDPILEAYVEQDLSPDQIVELGFDGDTVGRIVAMVDSSEYKRRQAPPGIKIRPKAFGRDRRLPITNRFQR